MPFAAEPAFLNGSTSLLSPFSDAFSGCVAYGLLRAYAYSGLGRECGLRASFCDNEAASRTCREVRERFCGRRSRVAMLRNWGGRRESRCYLTVPIMDGGRCKRNAREIVGKRRDGKEMRQMNDASAISVPFRRRLGQSNPKLISAPGDLEQRWHRRTLALTEHEGFARRAPRRRDIG